MGTAGLLALVLKLQAILPRLLLLRRHHRHRLHQETFLTLMAGRVDLVQRLDRQLQRRVWGQ